MLLSPPTNPRNVRPGSFLPSPPHSPVFPSMKAPALLRRLAFLLMVACFTLPATAQKPNILLLLADDLGINDLGCYGRTQHRTPNLDKLAAEGKRFTAASCAIPVCSPSRAAILTGQNPARLHITNFLPGRADWPGHRLLQPPLAPLPNQTPIIADPLKAAGYTTACIGKWHLGNVKDRTSFDYIFAGKANTPPSATEGGKGEWEQTQKAVEFIEANAQKPFFLHLAFHSPHVPLAAQTERIAAYSQTFNPIYAAMIESLDAAVGKLLNKLDSLGLRNNTLVIFCSDNGGLHIPELPHTPATHNTPFRAGKGFLYEGGLRDPLLIRWPARVAPGEVSSVVNLGDLAPTILEAGNAQPLAPADYTSLIPLLTDSGSLKARPLFWHMPNYTNQGGRPSGAVREEDWKLIEHYEDGRLELFNLREDPSEKNDRSAAEPARVAAMRGRLETWRREIHAEMPRPNPVFQPELWRACYAKQDVSRTEASQTAVETAAPLLEWREAMDKIRHIKQPAPGTPVPEPSPVSQPPAMGLVQLEPKDAILSATKLRYEPQPHKDTLGFWVEPADWAEWECEVPQSGAYAVEILQGCSKGGSLVEVRVGGASLTFTVEDTGHFQRFVPRKVGVLELPAGKTRVALKPVEKKGGAIMDVRRLSLVRELP
jgi:arylsulfatase A